MTIFRLFVTAPFGQKLGCLGCLALGFYYSLLKYAAFSLGGVSGYAAIPAMAAVGLFYASFASLRAAHVGYSGIILGLALLVWITLLMAGVGNWR